MKGDVLGLVAIYIGEIEVGLFFHQCPAPGLGTLAGDTAEGRVKAGSL